MTKPDMQSVIYGLRHYTPEMHRNFHLTKKSLVKSIDLWTHELIRSEWMGRNDTK